MKKTKTIKVKLYPYGLVVELLALGLFLTVISIAKLFLQASVG